MKLSFAILAATAAPVSGKRGLKNIPQDLSNVEVKAESKAGNKLLSKARRLDGADEYTWIAGYSLKFISCSAYQDYYGGQFAGWDENYPEEYYNYKNGQYNGNGANGQYNANAYGGNDGGRRTQNNQYGQYGQNGQYGQYNGANGNYGNNREYYEGMYAQQLVRFKLCPTDSPCWRCPNGAEYVVTMNDFVEAILEARMTAQEYNCEKVRDNCYCDNADSEYACYYGCYKNAGMTDCADAMEENEFELQDAVECAQLEVDEDAVKGFYYSKAKANQNQNRNQYYVQGEEVGEVGELYVGPYCAKNGKKIHLGVFMDNTCSYPAPRGIYEATHYGDSLPFSRESLIDHGCMSCKEPKEIDYENYWDQNDPDEVIEACTNLYEMAGKCEENLDGYYPNRDVTGCAYIKSLKSIGINYPRANVPAKVLAGIFGMMTACLAAVSLMMCRRDQRQRVSLAAADTVMG